MIKYNYEYIKEKKMEEKIRNDVEKKIKTPVKVGLVEMLLIIMTCTVIALGAVYCILH